MAITSIWCMVLIATVAIAVSDHGFSTRDSLQKKRLYIYYDIAASMYCVHSSAAETAKLSVTLYSWIFFTWVLFSLIFAVGLGRQILNP